MTDSIKRGLDGLTALLCLSAAVLLGKAILRDREAPTGIRAQPERQSEASDDPRSRMNLEAFFGLAESGLRIGREDARVVAVVFTAYSCGYCAELERSLRRLREIYPQHLAVVYKHYIPNAERTSLENHLGAECANEQGRFSEYHRIMFEVGRVAIASEPWRIVADSVELLDMRRFVRCVRGEAFRARVEADTRTGSELGVQGTPTTFINGVPLIGAPPFEALDSLVALELNRRMDAAS